jgi:ATP-binding cassette, subfamily B, bacterial
MNSHNLIPLAWPLAQANEALEALAVRSKLLTKQSGNFLLPAAPTETTLEALNQWLESAAGQLDIETESVYTLYSEVEVLLRQAGPALLQINLEGQSYLLALLDQHFQSIRILSPDLTTQKISLALVSQILTDELKSPYIAEIDKILGEAQVPSRQRTRARAAILQEKLGQRPIGGCWLLRPLPGSNFWQQLQRLRITRQLVLLVGAHSIQYFLLILSWIVIGLGALQGKLDSGWIAAWMLLLLSIIPFRMAVQALEGRVVVGVWGPLKQRLLFGALHLRPDEIRHQGIGQFLGRVAEADGVEMLGVLGIFFSGLACVEIIIALIILSASEQTIALALVGWLIFTTAAAFHSYRATDHWTNSRLTMTHDLVERMVGHRTRLAQEPPDRWHHGEDEGLNQYVVSSQSYDRATLWMTTVVPRGWLVAAFTALAFDYTAGTISVTSLAISLGAILLVYRSLRSLVAGLFRLASAAVAWKQAAPLYQAATRSDVKGVPLSTGTSHRPEIDPRSSPLLAAHDLVFRYQSRPESVLNKCRLDIYAGDRVLLEGPSGCGKSTLVAVLAGLRQPESGLIFLHGLDEQTYGFDAWRRHIATAPQFHENHIMAESFLFNVLMSRNWPPHYADMQEAETICRELGLGELLDRMPGGILQMVGDTGWQLSHGERSRLYIARALLQGAELIVLDESFAALDPDTLRQAMECVLKRAPTLLVVAHP